MRDPPSTGRPYEKCLCHDLGGLTDAELLAIIIHTDNGDQSSLALSEELLALDSPGDGLLGLLYYSLSDFMKIKGVGEMRGMQLLCIGELSRRVWKRRARVNPISFENPQEISDYYMGNIRHLKQEEIRVIFLNTKQALIEGHLTSRGTVNASVITSREILIEALHCCAVSMVLVHNHPNGDSAPSRAGRTLTGRVKEAGALVGITLTDHTVIGDRCYLSFHEQKILQEEVNPWNLNAANTYLRDLRYCMC